MSIAFTESGSGADVFIVFTETGTADDSGFTAGPFADTGAASDTIGTGPVITDTGSGTDTLAAPAVAAPLAESGAGDDLPWEYVTAGTPVFPYYADIPEAAAARVKAGDSFLWYAGS